MVPEKRRRNGVGGLVLPPAHHPGARRGHNVPGERAGRAPRVGHGAAAGAAGAGARQLPRLAPARHAAARAQPGAAAQDAAVRGRQLCALVQLSH